MRADTSDLERLQLLSKLGRSFGEGLLALVEHAVERAVAEAQRPIIVTADRIEMLTVGETAKRLSLSRRTVLELIYRHELAAHRLSEGGKWLVSAESVAKWVAARLGVEQEQAS